MDTRPCGPDEKSKQPDAASVSEAQRAELRARLAHHRANPDEAGITFAQLKTKSLVPLR